MKSNRDFRGRQNHGGPDDLKKSVKLQPARKSGKERSGYLSLYEEEDEIESYKDKQESVFDYFDDEDEEEEN